MNNTWLSWFGHTREEVIGKMRLQDAMTPESALRLKVFQEDADKTSIVSTIISLAQSLRLKVVAEGVETEQQAQLLRLLRCDQIQGFLTSPAVPAGDVEAFFTY